MRVGVWGLRFHQGGVRTEGGTLEVGQGRGENGERLWAQKAVGGGPWRREAVGGGLEWEAVGEGGSEGGGGGGGRKLCARAIAEE